jgi:hypothetical protein
MARVRVVLQPPTRLTSTDTLEQSIEEALRVGNAHEGVVYVNVMENQNASGSLTFKIQTASDARTGTKFWRE